MLNTKESIKPFTLLSPAKLNLALGITGRQRDGFHTLNTIFERISLSDELTFSFAGGPDIRLSCTHTGVPVDKRNLVYKAAQALREATGVQAGARVHIVKNIPVAAGLAGGSSNAATALLGLNRLWRLNLSRAVLLRLAKRIGSDVAFFLHDASFAQGTGRGDKIKILPVKHRFWHVLITAKQPLLTKDVYGTYARDFLAADLKSANFTKKTSDVRMLVRSLKVNDIATVQAVLFNDLEGPIGVLRPGLLRLKARVSSAGGAGACFSGSGPSIFALTQTQAEAKGIAKLFRRSYKQVFVVHTL